MLGVFTLLPGSALGGGRVLHGLVWWRAGDHRGATRADGRRGRSLLHRRHRTVEFTTFLSKLDAIVPAHRQVHLIADNWVGARRPRCE